MKTNEKVYAVPTVQESSMISIRTDDNIEYDESLRRISKLMGKISDEEINTFYESPFYNDALIIDDSLIDTGYIKVTGKHYGQVTMTPCYCKYSM